MKKERVVYIDNLKVFLTCMVVAHHAGQAYGPTGGMWLVNDTSSANWLGDFFFINASYMMGLFFFISGYFLVFSLRRKTGYEFFIDRVKRLGIPLLFFTLLVFLPINYILSGSKGNIFLFFLDSYLHHPPAATGHLWFVAMLLAFNLIYYWMLNKPFVALSSRTGKLKTSYLVVFILLVALLSALVRLKYPIDKWQTWVIPMEPAHLPQYFLLFLGGVLFNYTGWLNQLDHRRNLVFFCLAITCFILHYKLPAYINEWWLTESLMETILCTGIILGLLSFFKLYVNWSNNLLSRMSAASYGIYLFHLFVVILLQRGLLEWQLHANIKFLLVSVIGILLSLLVTMLVQRSNRLKSII